MERKPDRPLPEAAVRKTPNPPQIDSENRPAAVDGRASSSVGVEVAPEDETFRPMALPASDEERGAIWQVLLRQLPREVRHEVLALRHRVGFESAIRRAEELAWAEKILRRAAKSEPRNTVPPPPESDRPASLEELLGHL